MHGVIENATYEPLLVHRNCKNCSPSASQTRKKFSSTLGHPRVRRADVGRSIRHPKNHKSVFHESSLATTINQRNVNSRIIITGKQTGISASTLRHEQVFFYVAKVSAFASATGQLWRQQKRSRNRHPLNHGSPQP